MKPKKKENQCKICHVPHKEMYHIKHILFCEKIKLITSNLMCG